MAHPSASAPPRVGPTHAQSLVPPPPASIQHRSTAYQTGNGYLLPPSPARPNQTLAVRSLTQRPDPLPRPRPLRGHVSARLDRWGRRRPRPRPAALFLCSAFQKAGEEKKSGGINTGAATPLRPTRSSSSSVREPNRLLTHRSLHELLTPPPYNSWPDPSAAESLLLLLRASVHGRARAGCSKFRPSLGGSQLSFEGIELV